MTLAQLYCLYLYTLLDKGIITRLLLLYICMYISFLLNIKI